ncbi:hypothetical protein O6B97_08220 [Campylobacter ureolyticus]|uniref:hypothetical protein n=1 Tax=Campylobacter ureolyticus TaxID=827 RepID=UPI0022B3B0BE|nr:hypothetical protein [Campylobacter ureolyticus]MCZ6187071.1 hypothetical protein [Campylobacter ureolyticus]
MKSYHNNEQIKTLPIENFSAALNKITPTNKEFKLELFTDDNFSNMIIIPMLYNTVVTPITPINQLLSITTRHDNIADFKTPNNQKQTDKLSANFTVKKRHFNVKDKDGNNKKIVLYTPEWLNKKQITTINSFFKEAFYRFENELGIKNPLEKIKDKAKSLSQSCKAGDLSSLFAIYEYKILDNQVIKWIKAYKINDYKRFMAVINRL